MSYIGEGFRNTNFDIYKRAHAYYTRAVVEIFDGPQTVDALERHPK